MAIGKHVSMYVIQTKTCICINIVVSQNVLFRNIVVMKMFIAVEIICSCSYAVNDEHHVNRLHVV